MADRHDSGGQADRAARIAPLVGLPGQTSGEAVASVLRQKNRARRRSEAIGDDSERVTTTEDNNAI